MARLSELPQAITGALPHLPVTLPRSFAELHERIPTWREIGSDPVLLRRGMNLWPPFRFAGIRVVEIEPEFRGATVELRLTPLSRNYVGTQYGGSLFSMTDPFWMILLGHRLGEEYIVWDRRAEIEFLAPGRTDVRTSFSVPDELVSELVERAEGGAKVLHWLENDIVGTDGGIVARVRRQLYVRGREHSRGY